MLVLVVLQLALQRDVAIACRIRKIVQEAKHLRQIVQRQGVIRLQQLQSFPLFDFLLCAKQVGHRKRLKFTFLRIRIDILCLVQKHLRFCEIGSVAAHDTELVQNFDVHVQSRFLSAIRFDQLERLIQ
uniref:Putative secreted protein n=1 Tax=Anopheles darlingi TaxID=43151 RepID=A0A2M4D2K6_ANODA